MANRVNNTKKFKHDSSYDIFPDPKDLNIEAIRAGLTPEEFTKKYLSYLYRSKIWNTASEFIATITSVSVENTGNNTLTAVVNYIVGDEKSQTLRIGIISPQPDPSNPNNALATKAKNCVNRRAKIIRGYVPSREDDADYAFLLDIEPL
jgi:hypothetical protein